MVVDKYVGRCLDVGSTPTGSIIPLHSFAFLGKTLLNQRFLFLSLVFLGILLRKKDTTKESQTDPKADPIFKKRDTKKTQHLSYPRNNFFLRKTWDSNPRTLLHAYRVSNTAS